MRQAEIKSVAIYCRVSTSEQDTDRQVADLKAFARRRNYSVHSIYVETASGAKNDRHERAKVMQLARDKKIDAILVTELSRWGRSTIDTVGTMDQLAGWKVSLIAQTGLELDLTTPHGKLMRTLLAALAEHERDLIRERTMSGLAAARSAGRIGGRKPGQNLSDKYAKQVMKHLADGRTVRSIAHDLQISTNTVQAIKKRHQVAV